MSLATQALLGRGIQILNRAFWLASIVVWIWIVIRSGILSGKYSGPPENFMIFMMTGAAVAATTHFLASALPLALGVTVLMMVGPGSDAKGAWFLGTIYIMSALVIGFFAGLLKLFRFLADQRGRQELQELKSVLARDRQETEAILARDPPPPRPD